MSGIFVDSNCWLYLLLQGQDLIKESRLRERLTGRNDLVISTQVITEVAANLVNMGRMPEDQLMLRLSGLRDAVGELQIVGWKTHSTASRIRTAGGFSYMGQFDRRRHPRGRMYGTLERRSPGPGVKDCP